MSSLAHRLAEVVTGYKPVPAKYCPQVPTTKQAAALSWHGREMLYGGAGAGGKTAYLLMAALQWVDSPKYAALILRRTFADLNKPDAIMSRAHEWWQNTDAKWDAEKRQFVFPSGAVIAFGYLESENDKFQYQGAAYQFVGFDEGTQFTESQYTYVLSRLRRLEGSSVPIRARMTSNPGGRGHDWVRSRFVSREGRGPDRIFIQARLEDNPHIDQEEYDRQLALLDHITRRQIRHGDWDVRPDGDLFKRGWFRLVDVPPERPAWRVRFWDFAGTKAEAGRDPDYTAGVLLSWTPGFGFCVEDVVAIRESPAEVERVVRRTAERDAKLPPADVGQETCIEEEGGASGKFMVRDFLTRVLAGFTARAERSAGDKVFYARGLSAAAENGQLSVVRAPWNQDFIDECVAFPLGSHDDRVDAASKALARLQVLLRGSDDIGAPVSIAGGMIPRRA